MLRELFVSYCVLVSLTLVSCTIVGIRAELPTTWKRRLTHWAALCVCGLILMYFRVALAGGVIIGFYAVPAALAGIFGGMTWAVATVVPIALYRLSLGGPGALPGALHVVVAGLVAAMFPMGPSALRAPVLQVLWRTALSAAISSPFVLLLPGASLALYLAYYPLMVSLGAFATLVCVLMVKMRVDSFRELAIATTMAHMDPLTGLPNQRTLMEAITARPAERLDCFLLLDVDHFKRINDTYGHLTGDEVLRHLGRVLRMEVRSTDLVCRYGGEEFVVLMRGCTLAGALDVAERVRQAVSESVIATEGRSLHVTLSGGLVTVHAGQPFTELFQEADSLLYKAKQRGRNRIVYPTAS